MAEAAVENKPLKVVSLREFAEEKGFKQIVPTVRTNMHTYPYLTLIDDKNVAENVYFSKETATRYKKGDVIPNEDINKLMVAETSNAEGEIRHKLTYGGGRVELAEVWQ